MEKVIFFGNGALADYVLEVLRQRCEVIFHARTREDLEEACRLKKVAPEAHGVLVSFGVLIPGSVLEVFEPEGILNVHPSLLPSYRGASPIESAILDGATEFSVSVMKLVKAMDAGPVYYQATFPGDEIAKRAGVGLALPGLPESKDAIYRVLGEAGAEWICSHLGALPEPVLQDDAMATFCGKFEKKDGVLDPATETREAVLRKIVAFFGFPKVKCAVFGVPCTILGAHIPEAGETAVVTLECADGPLAIDFLQPDGRKVMDAKAFKNGYGR
ncbi:hypothetical protein IJH33_01895 [Candidatus Saccharibacteria bacterium]|nr:hypothetical protein [Candidatus Saccharibacteria bacterium]